MAATKKKWVGFKSNCLIPADMAGEKEDTRVNARKPVQVPAFYADSVVSDGFADHCDAPKKEPKSKAAAGAKAQTGAGAGAGTETQTGAGAQSSGNGSDDPVVAAQAGVDAAQLAFDAAEGDDAKDAAQIELDAAQASLAAVSA